MQRTVDPARVFRARAIAPGNTSRRKSRGNAMLEVAFVLVMLLAILFAILDYGLAVFVRSTFQEAVREGVRYAITYRTQTGMGQDDSVRSVVQSNAMGFLNGTDNFSKIHVDYYDPTTLTATSFNGPGSLVVVSIQGYTWNWLMPLGRDGTPLTINVSSSDRMEGLPSGATAPPTR
jgi:Flp pilus assembly protein TadG